MIAVHRRRLGLLRRASATAQAAGGPQMAARSSSQLKSVSIRSQILTKAKAYLPHMLRQLYQGTMLEPRERRAEGDRVDDWLYVITCLLVLSISFQPYAEGTRMPLEVVVLVIRCSTKLRSPSLTSIRPRPAHDVLENDSTRCAAYQHIRSMPGANITTQVDRAVGQNENMQLAPATNGQALQGHSQFSL